MNPAALRKQLPLWIKLLYGSGDWGISSIGMMRSIFYAIYLTEVVGLDPRLGSFGALVGIVWDAINDPIIGLLSDRLRTRWGRRRPFLLWLWPRYPTAVERLARVPPVRDHRPSRSRTPVRRSGT